MPTVNCYASVFSACTSNRPLDDPDPNDDSVRVDYSGFVTQIALKEGIADIRIAVFNCDGKSRTLIPSEHTYLIHNSHK
jgi:hypothetical protein